MSEASETIRDLIDATAGMLTKECGMSENAAEDVRYFQDVLLVVVKKTIEVTVGLGVDRGIRDGWTPFVVGGHAFRTKADAEAAFAGIVAARCRDIFETLGLP